MQPIYRDKPFVSVCDGTPCDEVIFERGLCLPSDIKMTDAEQDAVIEIINDCFRG
jgi:dTDP-4-amino-4,6-dideoxygalactose transaminase